MRTVFTTALATTAAVLLAQYLLLETIMIPVGWNASCPKIQRPEARRQMSECLERAACIWAKF